MARIAALTYYPVKGCAGISADAAAMTPAGLAHDRSFLITGADGTFRSQRRHPQLALIRPEISADGGRLTLHGPALSPLAVDVSTSGARRDVELFGNPYKGIDQGAEAAGWLSEFLGAPTRLMRVPPEHDRVTDGRTPGTSGYADSCAVHLLSTSTLELLGERMAGQGGAPLPVDRFRPNLVVEGWEEPHVEDRVRHLTVGEAELGHAKPAIRCVVTLVDQAVGAKAGPEPLRTLAGYRRAAGGGVAFGAKFAVLRPGRVSVGDRVSVGAWGEPEL